MRLFGEIYPEQSSGQLTMFDRVLFKGHLSGLYPFERLEAIWYRQGVLLKEYKDFAESSTKQLRNHIEEMARAAGRPVQYLANGFGKQDESKEAMAQAIAERDQITQGLIVVFSSLELNQAVTVRTEPGTGHLHLVSEKRKQLHWYLYYLDDEFGFMSIRIQSWWPFTLQIYINGHEWLAKQMDREGIAYVRADNCFWQIAELERAQALCDKFAHRQWERVWQAFAARTNPLLDQVKAWTGKGYYWSIDQAEIATDVMFANQATLDALLPDLFHETLLTFSAEDVMRFLGRKLNGNFQGQIETRLNKRPAGWRVKHWVKHNAIKMYNKGPLLRVETTINNSDEFKIPASQTDSSRWKRMPKGVSYFWHFYQTGREANQRYLDALRSIPCQGKAAIEALDRLCQSQEHQGRSVAKFQPVDASTCQLFAAVLRGEHLLSGFRNRQICQALYDTPASDQQTEHRRRARVSRMLAKLAGHGLVQRVERSHWYRVTAHGYRAMGAALHYRQIDYPANFVFA
jgi:hypothetical protein